MNGRWLINVTQGRWPHTFFLSRCKLLAMNHFDQNVIEESSIPDKQIRGQLHAFLIILKIRARRILFARHFLL